MDGCKADCSKQKRRATKTLKIMKAHPGSIEGLCFQLSFARHARHAPGRRRPRCRRSSPHTERLGRHASRMLHSSLQAAIWASSHLAGLLDYLHHRQSRCSNTWMTQHENQVSAAQTADCCERSDVSDEEIPRQKHIVCPSSWFF